MERTTRQEFLRRQEAYNRQSNKEGIFFMVVMFLFFAVNWPLALYLDKQVARGSLFYWLWFSCFFLFFVCMGVAVLWFARRNLKRHGLLCPFCSKQLHRSIVVTTGRCGHCGERVVELD